MIQRKLLLNILLLLLLYSEYLFSYNYTVREKSRGESSSIYPEITENYIYNPSLLAINKQVILTPIEINFYSDKDSWTLVQNYKKFENLKDNDIINLIKEYNNKYLSLDLKLNTSFIWRSFSFALQGRSLFDALIKEKDVIPTLEYYTFEEIKLYISYGFKINKNLYIGLSLKNSYALSYYIREKALDIYNDETIINPIKNAKKNKDIDLDIAMLWENKINENLMVYLGNNLSNLNLYSNDIDDGSYYEVNHFFLRSGAGLALNSKKYNTRVVFSYGHINDFREDSLVNDQKDNQLGIGFDFFQQFHVGIGYSHNNLTYGFSYSSDNISLGYASFVDKSPFLSLSHYKRRNGYYLRISYPFTPK